MKGKHIKTSSTCTRILFEVPELNVWFNEKIRFINQLSKRYLQYWKSLGKLLRIKLVLLHKFKIFLYSEFHGQFLLLTNLEKSTEKQYTSNYQFDSCFERDYMHRT